MPTSSASKSVPAQKLAKTNPATKAAGAEASPVVTLEHERFCLEKQLLDILTGKVLKRGAKGPGVKALQNAFSDMGFLLPGTADGIFGRQTAKAVSNFQVHASKTFADMTVNGIVNAATLLALDSLAPLAGQSGQSKNLPIPYYKGTKLRIVVLKDEHRTFLYDKQGAFVRVCMNAVGASATPTTTGLKVIASKLDEKIATEVGMKLWNAPVLGARILDLRWANGKHSGEELHGTVVPEALGEDVSHGCIRHENADIIALFDAVKVGDKVGIAESAADPNLRK